MQKAKLTVNTGSRALLPDEVRVVDSVNGKLQASAQRHGRDVKKLFVLQTEKKNGATVHRAVLEKELVKER